MTPKDCLLVAICFMAASLLLKVAQPALVYILAVLSVILWFLFGWFGFPLIIILLSMFGGSFAFCFYEDDESTQFKLAFTACGVITLAILLCGVRLLWPYVHAYYYWTPDDKNYLAVMATVAQFSVHFCVICAVILTLLAFSVKVFQQPMFGVAPFQQEEQEMRAMDKPAACLQEANEPANSAEDTV